MTVKNAISGNIQHASMRLKLVKQKLEQAYVAHIEDSRVCDIPTPFNRTLMRHTCYNWLGFMWHPGLGQKWAQVKPFMYCS